MRFVAFVPHAGCPYRLTIGFCLPANDHHRMLDTSKTAKDEQILLETKGCLMDTASDKQSVEETKIEIKER